MTVKRTIKQAILALCLLPALASCSATKAATTKVGNFFSPPKEEVAAVQISCPETGLMQDAQELPVFYGDSGRAEDLAVTGILGGIRGGCNFDTPGQAEMELQIHFGARKGPKGVALRKQVLPYFIAILGPDETILQRAAFSTKVDFDNKETVTTVEEHDLKVPVPSREAAGSYKVVVGFQLTPEQLAYIREHKVQDAPKN